MLRRWTDSSSNSFALIGLSPPGATASGVAGRGGVELVFPVGRSSEVAVTLPSSSCSKLRRFSL